MTICKFNIFAFSLLSRSNENAAVIFYFARECFRSGFRFIKSNSSENIQQQGQNASKLTVSNTELCKFCLLTCLRLMAFRQLAI